MTLYIFHGDNISASRKAFRDQVQIYQNKGYEIREISGDKLEPKELESILATSNLFTPETVVIEGLFSRLKSKAKDACISILQNYAGEKNIICWDKKEITKLTLSKLPKTTKNALSKLPAIIFTFLDTLIPGNAKNSLNLFHELILSTNDLLIHTMISRHISNLIIASSATTAKLPPWQLGKLKSQAKQWNQDQLISFHDELLKIDYLVKTGQSKLDFASHLDILLLKVLG